jgi:CRISPR-associated endonuclease/helicase Cas3
MQPESKTQTIYANSKRQLLAEHSYAVGKAAEIIYYKFFDIDEDQAVGYTVFIAGCLHDIGKNEPNYQSWVLKQINELLPDDGEHITSDKFSFEKYPQHQEISVLIYHLLDAKSVTVINQELKQIVKHVIRWHHRLPFRKAEIQQQFHSYADIITKLEANNINIKELISNATDLLAEIATIEANYTNKEPSIIAKCYQLTINNNNIDEELPAYKNYDADCKQLKEFHQKASDNSMANIVRACVITADRWVSSLSATKLQALIANKKLADFVEQQFEINKLNIASDLTNQITTCLANFPEDTRSKQQTEVANKLITDDEYITVLAGVAGCGKTKIALEFAKNTDAQQIIWICPRVQICQGLFDDLTSKQYLQNATIEIYTGEYKYTNSYDDPTDKNNYFSGNIVITTIDQILNTIISHTKIDRLLNFLSAHVVFDEYHEYITMPAFNLLFAELLIARKKLKGGTKALLVSATPHYAYLKDFLDIDLDDDVIEMPSFNNCKYKFEFVEYDENQLNDSNPLYKPQSKSTFVISNTAKTAQLSFLKNASENSLLYHSKFIKEDKKSLFKQVFNCFKQDGSNKYDILRSGPIIQASLNITCNNMVSEITTPENNLQRLGRLNRFGININKINKFIIALPKDFTVTKTKSKVAKFLAKHNCLKTTLAWYQFLYKATKAGKGVFTLAEIYSLYKNFYQQAEFTKSIQQDLLAAMQQSAIVIADKLNAPLTIKQAKDNANRIKISINSLRGDNRFVQLAVCNATDISKLNIKDEYAYEIPNDETVDINNITESLDKIRALKLLEHAAKKDARINPDTSKIKGIKKSATSSREAVIANLAREPENPIYLSYTPTDLEKIGNEKQHANAMFYITTDRQPVGTLLLKEINNAKNNRN